MTWSLCPGLTPGPADEKRHPGTAFVKRAFLPNPMFPNISPWSAVKTTIQSSRFCRPFPRHRRVSRRAGRSAPPCHNMRRWPGGRLQARCLVQRPEPATIQLGMVCGRLIPENRHPLVVVIVKRLFRQSGKCGCCRLSMSSNGVSGGVAVIPPKCVCTKSQAPWTLYSSWMASGESPTPASFNSSAPRHLRRPIWARSAYFSGHRTAVSEPMRCSQLPAFDRGHGDAIYHRPPCSNHGR